MLLPGEEVYFDHKISDCIMTMVPPLTAVNEIKFYSRTLLHLIGSPLSYDTGEDNRELSLSELGN